MSARHRRKLFEQNNVSKEEDSDESSEEEVFNAPTVSLAALQFSDSDSDSASSTSDSGTEEEIENGENSQNTQESFQNSSKNQLKNNQKSKQNAKMKNQSSFKNIEGGAEEIDDDELALEEFRIENNNIGIKFQNNDSLNNCILNINISILNIDLELKRKFGKFDHSKDNEDGGGRRRRQKRGFVVGNHNIMKLQKSIFSHPHEEWTRPPSFVAGGIRLIQDELIIDNDENDENQYGLIKNCEFYKFEHSKEYIEKTEELLFHQSTGDIKNIIIFLSENPTHIETLLQLAIICLKTNNKNMGLDLIKRCLYVYEMTFTQYNSTNNNNSHHEHILLKNKILLNYNVQTNQFFFQTLYHFMKICGMMGCESTSFEISKLLLSLNPKQDPMNVLLHIDYYALFTHQYTQLHQICEIDLNILYVDDVAFNVSSTSSPSSSSSSSSSSSTTITPNMEKGKKRSGSVLKINDLPNLQFSNALAYFLQSSSTTTTTTSTTMKSTKGNKSNYKSNNLNNEIDIDLNEEDVKEKLKEYKAIASKLLLISLQKFPCFLIPLLKKMGEINVVQGSSNSQIDWNSIISHPFFNPRQNDSASSSLLLIHFSEIYVKRCGLLWKRKDIINWVYEIAKNITDDITSSSTSTSTSSSSSFNMSLYQDENEGINKYNKVSLNEFNDEYEQMPELEDGQPIIDVELLSYEKQKELKLIAQQQHIGQRRYIRQQQQEHRRRQQEALFDDSDEHSFGRIGGRTGHHSVHILDPSAPLLQMFWQSALPWNEVNFFPNRAPMPLAQAALMRAQGRLGGEASIDEYIRNRPDLQPPP